LISFKKLQEFKATDSGKNLMMPKNEIIFIKFEAYVVVNCWTKVNVKEEERITTKEEEEDGDEDRSKKSLAHDTMLIRRE